MTWKPCCAWPERLILDDQALRSHRDRVQRSHVSVRSITGSTVSQCHDLHHRNTPVQGIYKQPPPEEPSGLPRTEASGVPLNDWLLFEVFQRPEESLQQLRVKHRLINDTSSISLQPRDGKFLVTLGGSFVFETRHVNREEKAAQTERKRTHGEMSETSEPRHDSASLLQSLGKTVMADPKTYPQSTAPRRDTIYGHTGTTSCLILMRCYEIFKT